MQLFRWGFLKLWEPVSRFHVSGGAAPRIYQLGPQGWEGRHAPLGGLQPGDLTGAWDSRGTSRNAILRSSSQHLPQDRYFTYCLLPQKADPDVLLYIFYGNPWTYDQQGEGRKNPGQRMTAHY